MTEVLRRFIEAPIQTVGAREFRAIAATSALQLDGWALSMSGVNLERFSDGRGPLLYEHDRQDVLGTVSKIAPVGKTLPMTGKFFSAGINELADDICAKLKDGGPFWMSVCYQIDQMRPISQTQPTAGMLATAWTLLEVSVTSVPVDPKAIVTARSRRGQSSSPAAMQAAIQSCDGAIDAYRAAGRHHQEIADATERLNEHRTKAGTALRNLKSAIESGDKESAAECHARCQRQMAGMHRELQAIGDRHGDAMDCHSVISRALRAIGLQYGSSLATQESAGVIDDAGERQRRMRRVRVLKLAAPIDVSAEASPTYNVDSYQERQQRICSLS
jgi:hypothetical protein